MAGIALPQLAPASEDRVSGALVAGGCVKFDGDKNQYLKRDFQAGNRTNWTFSSWIKRSKTSTDNNNQTIFEARGGNNDNDYIQIKWRNATVVDSFNVAGWNTNFRISSQVFRDYSAWYHVVVSMDTGDTAPNRIRIYINGELLDNTRFQTSNSPSGNTGPNGAVPHHIGYSVGNSGQPADFYMAQTTFIDGLTLGCEYFGFTDPLTGIWRPKKFRAQGTTINEGIQWSSGGGSGLYSGSTWGPTFDGTPASDGSNIAHSAYVTNSGTSTVTFSKPISGVLRFRACQGSNSPSTGSSRPFVTLSDGQEIRVDGANNAPSMHSFGYVSGITSVTITGTSSQGMNLLYLEVDGVLMKDSTTQNLAFGTNGFYLPMDGNSPIGQDHSGNGNDWTPVNFGGSVELDRATGAKPILNTGNGGNIVRPGVFGSEVGAFYTTTSASNSGGKYYFSHDASAQPTFSFIRGATYTFDYSASSGHPLRFATAADAAGSTEYTNGTSISGNVIKFTVPHNAPDTLYYYCNVHNGMGNSISVTTDETKADPYAWKNVLALPLVGSAIDESKNLNCTQSAAKAVTANGNAAASNAYSNFYGGSYYLDGNGDYLTLANSADFAFGTGDFTIETYIFPTDVTNYKNFYEGNTNGSTTASVRLQIKNTGVIEYLVNNVGRSTSAVVPASTWTHVALTRASNTVRLFVNGVNVDEYTNSGNLTSQSLQIGRTHDNYDYVGYIQDYRVYKGVAKYTSNFIPAATNPNILPDSPSGVATKSKLKKVTDGSVGFDGVDGTALLLDSSSDIQLGSGSNWTIEFFAYRTGAFADYDVIIGKGLGGDFEWFIEGFADGSVDFMYSNNGTTTWSGQHEIMASMVQNRWYHIAIVRNGSGANNFKMYVDGKQTFQTTAFDIHAGNANLHIGGYGGAAAQDPPIIISNLRIVKGTSVYTAEFTPPTTALTNVTNTKLLCCQSPTSHTQATVIPDLANFPAPYSAAARFGSYKEYTTVNRNATSGTTLPMSNPTHYGGKALDLSSGGFQITTVNSATQDFFMGMWVHFDNYQTGKQFGVDIAGNYVYFELQSSGAIKIRHTGDGGSTSSSTNLNDGNWHHIALSRTSNTLYGFVDGSAVVSDNGGTGGNSISANCKFNFWGADNNFTSYNIDGQIIDAFIYIGQGVSSYTNPTAPLVGNDGTINHFSGFSDTQAYYISPCVDITGSQANSIPGSFTDVAGASTGTAANFNPFPTDIDEVHGQKGSYATLNPLLNSKFQSKKLKNGNLELSGNMGGGSGYPTAFSNFTMNGSGKFYMEATPFNTTDTSGVYIGLCDDQMISNATTVANTYPGGPGGVAYAANGTIADNNSNTFTSQPTYTAGDVISVAYDADNGKVYFAKNGVYINDANPVTGANPHDTGRTGDQYFVVGGYENRNVSVNFGQKPFSFPPPDGYQPLTSSTLRPETVVARSDKYFSTTLYVGNGASSPGASGGTQTIDVGHKPDLIWIKDRTQDHDHNLIDTIRGAGSILMSNATTAPPITNSTDAVTAFTDKGFTLGDNGEGTQSLELNKNGNNYVVWSWVAGGTPTATNNNTSGAMDANSVSVDGVLQSAYTPSGSPNIYPKKMSVGTKQGFSIIEYGGNSTSGAKVPHGLTQAPDFMVIKTTTLNGQGWGTYHQGIGATKYLQLQVTDHQSNDYAGFLNNTAPTNQVFTLGNDNFVNTGHTYMAYCWHDVPGLQKFGTFIGNDSTNFVELGFKPSLVWVKRVLANSAGDASDAYTSWTIMDHKRLSYNGTTPNHMYVNRARAEGYRGNGSDTSSKGHMTLEPQGTGFIMTGPGSEVNSSTGKYIYCAWAEQPAFNLYGAMSNAR